MYRVSRYRKEKETEWNSFVSTAKNATFLFHRDFVDYHSDRFEDFSLMVYKKDKLFAVLPANKKGTIVFSHQGLTYGSFILQDSAKLLDSFEAFKKTLEFLFTEGIKKLDIRVIPSFYTNLPSDELAYFMFKASAKLVKSDVIMLIDYSNIKPFQKNRREGINKAKRNNLEVKVDGDFDAFWNQILIPNLLEKHNSSPVHSLQEIKLLASRFPNNIHQVNVYREGEIIAGTTVFVTNNVVHPQYVSGNKDKNKFGSLDFLYNFIISHFKENKKYFSFNTSSESKGEVLNKGLLFWKEGCGARTAVFNNYQIETASYKTLEIKTI